MFFLNDWDNLDIDLRDTPGRRFTSRSNPSENLALISRYAFSVDPYVRDTGGVSSLDSMITTIERVLRKPSASAAV